MRLCLHYELNLYDFTTFTAFTSQATFAISNGTSGVDPACKARVGESAALQCLFAENVAPHLTTPLFALQAQYDAWQLGNILELRDSTGALAMPHLRGPLTPACTASTSCLAAFQGYRDAVWSRFQPVTKMPNTTNRPLATK